MSKNESYKKKSFVVYHDWFDNQFLDFTAEEIGSIIIALYQFDAHGVITDDSEFTDRAVRNSYKSCLAIIKANRANYEQKCAINRESASKGGKAKAANRYQSLQNTTDTDTDTDTDIDTDTDTDIDTGTDIDTDNDKAVDTESGTDSELSKSSPDGEAHTQSQLDRQLDRIFSEDPYSQVLFLKDKLKMFYWYYKNARKELHPVLQDDTVRRCIENLLEFDVCDHLNQDSFDWYFNTHFKDEVDYRLPHFCSDGVLRNLNYRVLDGWF